MYTDVHVWMDVDVCICAYHMCMYVSVYAIRCSGRRGRTNLHYYHIQLSYHASSLYTYTCSIYIYIYVHIYVYVYTGGGWSRRLDPRGPAGGAQYAAVHIQSPGGY
jgi:hypothetical protein